MKVFIILMLMCTSAFAADGLKMDNLKVNKIGVRAGLYDGDVGFGLLLPIGNLYKDFNFGTTLDYKSKDYVKFLSLGLRACYKLKDVQPMKNMKVYVGGGLAIHKVTVDLPTISILGSTIDTSASSTNLGVDGFVGVGYKLNKKMCLKGEAAYRVMSDYGHLALTGALVYNFR